MAANDAYEWLSLIDISGPFLAPPILDAAFPQGLDGLEGTKKRVIRQAYEEWVEAIDADDDDNVEEAEAENNARNTFVSDVCTLSRNYGEQRRAAYNSNFETETEKKNDSLRQHQLLSRCCFFLVRIRS